MGDALRVRMQGMALSSASDTAVLNGANVMAIGDGSPDRWEVFQFAGAELVGPREWALTRRLRGQAGTDALIPDVWPEGSLVVLLNRALVQVDMPLGDRGLVRHFRIGAAGLGYDDPQVVHLTESFAGAGLRPYAPVHLRAVRQGGDLAVGWVRRTRLDGDSWEAREVPLGEASEMYLVQVRVGGQVVRRAEVAGPLWTYPAAEQARDGTQAAAFTIEVAQVSESYGPGLFRSLDIDG